MSTSPPLYVTTESTVLLEMEAGGGHPSYSHRNQTMDENQVTIKPVFVSAAFHPSRHREISDNNTAIEPTKLLATFVVHTRVAEEGGSAALVVVGEEYRVRDFILRI
jgi:hypothetical protein